MATIRSSVAGGRDEDAGEDRARLVARGRAGDRAMVSTNACAGHARRGRRRRLREAAGSPRRAACGCGRSRCRRRARRPARRCAARASRRRRAASGRRRAAGGPAARRRPSRSTSASSGTRRPISMSVARSSTRPPAAAICTPDSAWTALRVEATRVTVCSWASSSRAEVESFIDDAPLRWAIEVIKGVSRCA